MSCFFFFFFVPDIFQHSRTMLIRHSRITASFGLLIHPQHKGAQPSLWKTRWIISLIHKELWWHLFDTICSVALNSEKWNDVDTCWRRCWQDGSFSAAESSYQQRAHWAKAATKDTPNIIVECCKNRLTDHL